MFTTITTEANLTADPALRYTKSSGQPVATILLAISSRRKNLDGEYADTPPAFYEGTVWAGLAEHVCESLHKGDRVLVHGSAYDEEFTDRDGNTRIKHVLQVTAIGASLRHATATIHRTNRKPAEQPAHPVPTPLG